MKSETIHFTYVGESRVSTIWYENAGTGYYETAVLEPGGKISIHEWGMELPIEAEAFHFATVELLDKAQRLHATSAGTLRYGKIAWTEIKTEDLP